MDYTIIKYPRTPHIEGSRLQPGDEDMSQRSFSEIAGRHIVIEEKIDGANTAVSFNAQNFPPERLRALMEGAGLEVLSGGAYDGFDHWVEQAITRDVVLARLDRKGSVHAE